MTATLPQFLRFGELLRAPGGDLVKARMLVAHLIADADGGDTIYPTPMWAESVSSFIFILAFLLRLRRCPAVIHALHSHIVGGYEFDDGATYFASARCTGCTNSLLLWPVRTLHYSCWSGAVFAPMLATPACVRAPISSFADSERDGSGALRERYARHARVCEHMFPASILRASWPWRSPCVLCSPHLDVCEQQFPASPIRDALALAMFATPRVYEQLFPALLLRV